MLTLPPRSKQTRFENRLLALLADTDQGLYLDELRTALGELATAAVERLVREGYVREYPGFVFYVTVHGTARISRASS